jgi:hypothetical protein
MSSVLTLPAVGFTLTIPNATTLVPIDDITYGEGAVGVPANCRTIVIFNMDAANRVFVRFGENAVVSVGNTTISNVTVLPTSSSMTFSVGYLGDRASLGMTRAENCFLMAEAGAGVLVNVTYLMGRGSNIL